MRPPIRFVNGENILLIASAGIGNLLQFTPALRALRHACPEASIDCLCLTNSAASAMRNNPHLTETINHTESSYIYSDPAERRRERQHSDRDRAIIKLLSRKAYASSINIYPISGLRPAVLVRRLGARKRIGTPLANPRYRWMTRLFYTHIVEISPDQHGVDIGFAHVGMDPTGQNRRMEFSIPESSIEAADKYMDRLGWDSNGRIVGIHPGCLARHWQKRWPVSRFIATARWLVNTKKSRVLIFVGPGERDLEEPLQEGLEELGQSCYIDTEAGLDDAAALMRRCDAFLSNDSGLMHLASAVGTPVLGIFGPTDPKRYAPSAPHDRYLHHSLECSNCYEERKMTSCPSAKCLQMITVEQVQNELDDMLRGAC